jgi:hypothetical protein
MVHQPHAFTAPAERDDENAQTLERCGDACA